MAKLPEYIPFTESITVRGKGGETVIELRGLNLIDITEVFKTHLPDLSQLAMLQDANGGVNMTEQSMLNQVAAIIRAKLG